MKQKNHLYENILNRMKTDIPQLIEESEYINYTIN